MLHGPKEREKRRFWVEGLVWSIFGTCGVHLGTLDLWSFLRGRWTSIALGTCERINRWAYGMHNVEGPACQRSYLLEGNSKEEWISNQSGLVRSVLTTFKEIDGEREV